MYLNLHQQWSAGRTDLEHDTSNSCTGFCRDGLLDPPLGEVLIPLAQVKVEARALSCNTWDHYATYICHYDAVNCLIRLLFYFDQGGRRREDGDVDQELDL